MWQPTTSLSILKDRAGLYNQIRQFFAARGVLEVETPILSTSTIADPHIHSLKSQFMGETLFLQTSPEFYMKRLLAFGSGSIYQIGKAFRADEVGKYHNPEFTLLEWYRVDFDHHQLMDEMDELLMMILNTQLAQRLTYQELFLYYLDLDPFAVSTAQLQEYSKKNNFTPMGMTDANKDDWLNFIMCYCIEPQLALESVPVYIYDFPISQGALARKNPHNPQVAERFEVYFRGMELANGFHELNDQEEQEMRFIAYNEERQKRRLEPISLDEKFLQCLPFLPNCAGVALGLDRLLMLKLNRQDIKEVIDFPLIP